MTLSIDLYCNDGSPIGVIPADIYGRGVGGAELAMMTWAERMAGRGHQVRIFNNPREVGSHSGVEYLPQGAFNPGEYRDVFVIYRSPNQYTRIASAGFKVHWSTDQQTVGNFATDIFPHVDRIVCISPYHVDYHLMRYGSEWRDKIGYFDLGVRLQDYDQPVDSLRVRGRCIFCSVPDRGLEVLRVVWPRLKKAAPHASLVITSDYTLWGAPGPLNHQHRLAWLHEQDVTFLGKVSRERLAQEQMAAEVHSYPCNYDELFCISAAECQVAGAAPVTSDFGALRTTNQWGRMLPGNPIERKWQDAFVESVVEAMEMPEASRQQMQHMARERFDWECICQKWEWLIEVGHFESKRIIA